MGKNALPILLAAALLQACLHVTAQVARIDKNAPVIQGNSLDSRNKIAGYTAWDDDFIYIAIQVNKPEIKASHSEPFSTPLQDDAAIITIQTDNDHKANHRNDHTYTIVISAANSAQLYSGTSGTPLFDGLKDFNTRLEDVSKSETDPSIQAVKRSALIGKLIKITVVQHGGQLPGNRTSNGYTIEAAVPWVDLGGKPNPGQKMGFNVAVQSVDPNAGSPPLQSFAQSIRSQEEVPNPSLLGTIAFNNEPTFSAPGELICPRVYASKPVIDGIFNAGEWNGLSGFTFGEKSAGTQPALLSRTIGARIRPAFTPSSPMPPVPISHRTVSLLSPHHPQPLAPTVFAVYDYAYQADTRKSSPAVNVLLPDGGTALTLHPLDGTGPWMSYDRADWHRHQMTELRRAGVDVVLPQYRAGSRDRQLTSDKGLLALSAALKYMKLTGQDYPQVGLFLDTDSLSDDLTREQTIGAGTLQSILYNSIQRFYQAIPSEFHFQTTLSAENGGRKACVVILSNAVPINVINESILQGIRSRFAADFNGCDLIILGGKGFEKSSGIDGFCTYPDAKGYQRNTDGWVKVGVIGAGKNARIIPSKPDPAQRPRRNGAAYLADWQSVLQSRPDWLLLQGWSDFAGGSAISPTMEEGFTNSDRTKIYTHLFETNGKLSARTLWSDLPESMLAGVSTKINFRVQNIGSEHWNLTQTPGSTPVGLAYRWIKNGAFIGNVKPVLLDSPILSGQTSLASVNVSAVNSDGSPLSAGDYQLQFGVMIAGIKGQSGTFLGDGGAVNAVNVHIVVKDESRKSELGALLLTSDLPSTLETGSVYTVHASIRNDSNSVWSKASVSRIGIRLYRTETKGSDTLETPVSSSDASSVLDSDIKPGETAKVKIMFPATQPDGTPLAECKQSDPWQYEVRWEVTPSPYTPEAGISFSPTPVALVPFDFGVRFNLDGTPESLPGDRRLPVRISLKNDGPQTWKKDEVRIGYHWYYQDGSEYAWEDETTPLAQDIKPGEKITEMIAWVTAPPNDGAYTLVWDLKVGDTWASTTGSVNCFDESVRAVEVIGGRLTYTDLTKSFNMDGMSEAGSTSDGDFDGKGTSFPADLTPPYAISPFTPSGSWLPTSKSGPESQRRICFRWGSKEGKAKNFISSRGQRIDFGKTSGQCRVLHILCASSGKDVSANLRLIFQEPTSVSEDQYSMQVSPWDQPPAHGEEVAYLSYGHHTPQGPTPGTIALFHVMVTIKEPRKLIAIKLPDIPELKIAAITLEK